MRAFIDAENGKLVLKVDFDSGEQELILAPQNLNEENTQALYDVADKINK